MPSERRCPVWVPWRHLFAMVFAAALAGGESLGRVSGDHINTIDLGLETPHTKWLKPYARGPIRVLMICSNWPYQQGSRSIVELCQRMAIDATVFTVCANQLEHRVSWMQIGIQGNTRAEKEAELLRRLDKPYDCYVFAPVNPKALPAEARYKILRAVADGAGLVLSGVHAKPLWIGKLKHRLDGAGAAVTRNIPLHGLSYFSGDVLKRLRAKTIAHVPERLVDGYRLGRGRVAVLNFPHTAGLRGRQEWFRYWETEHDYLIMLAAEAVLWTLPAKQPGVTVELPLADGAALARRDLPKRVGSIRVSAATGVPRELTVHVRVRDMRNVAALQRDVTLRVSDRRAEAVLTLPPLCAGKHFLDVIVSSARGREAWRAASFTVSAEPRIADVTVPRTTYESGDAITGTVTLATRAERDVPVHVYLEDTHGRIWQRADTVVKAGQNQTRFSVPTRHARAIVSWVTAELPGPTPKDPPIVRATRRVIIPRRQLREFPSLMWGYPHAEVELDLLDRQLRRAGFNILHQVEPPAMLMAALNEMVGSVYAYRVCLPRRKKCFWTEPEAKAAIGKTLSRVRAAMPFGPMVYSLGDENAYTYDHGYRDDEKVEFREYLKGVYGTLDRLNTEWQTRFTSWDAVEPFTVDRARAQRKTAARHDHMAFIEKCYADCHKTLARAIRRVDPKGLIGAEGSMPGDLEVTIQEMDFWGPYPHDPVQRELLRSIAPQFLRGAWWGGYLYCRELGPVVFWRQLLSGFVNMNEFYVAYGGEGFLALGLNYARCFDRTRRDLDEIGRGLGQLVSACRVDDRGVAILYSQVSNHFCSIHAPFGSPEAGQLSLIAEMDRRGIGYRFVTDRQVAAGALAKAGARLLFLPVASALSDKAVAALRQFVESGGVLVADVVPAIANGHARLLNTGRLDNLFGITRTGAPAAALTKAPWRWTIAGMARTFGGAFPVKVDTSVRVRGAGGPSRQVLTVARAGKGKAVHLGVPLSELLPSLDRSQADHFFGDLRQVAGIPPRLTVTGPAPELVKRFTGAGLTLVAMVLPDERAGPTTVHLGIPAHGYDVRAGRAVGLARTLTAGPADPAARVWAVFDKPQAPPTVSASKTARRGDVVTVHVTVPGVRARDVRIVRVEVFGPDGRERPCYRDYIRPGSDARFTYVLPLAYSDPPGRWTAKAVDVATNLCATIRLDVR